MQAAPNPAFTLASYLKEFIKAVNNDATEQELGSAFGGFYGELMKIVRKEIEEEVTAEKINKKLLELKTSQRRETV